MITLKKNKIVISVILAAIVCLTSFPGLTLAASAQLADYQKSPSPFHPIATDPDFSIYSIPSYLSINAGGFMNTTILVMSRYNFNGTISLSASVPTDWTATFTQSSLSLAGGYYGYYYGAYNWSTMSVAVPSGVAAGKYTVVVTGTNGSLTHSTNVTVNVVAPDFWMYAYPSYLSINVGTTANSTILLTSLYGFSGTVSLATTVPSGWTGGVVPSSLSVMPGYFNCSALSIAVPSNAEAGKYTVTVTGTSSSLKHSVNVTLNVVSPDFRIHAYPLYRRATAGSTVNSTIILSSLYGFSGTVSLSVSVPAGWTGAVVPSSISLTSGYPGYYNWSQISIVVPPGTAAGKYTVVVTATSGSLTHSANVTVEVVAPDFWISAYPPHLWVKAGSTANSTVVLSSLYGFSGTVSLTASVPGGWTGSLIPSSLSVKDRYFNCSALSVVVPSDTAVGKYTITVTGTSGSITHSANVTVNVVSSDFEMKP